MQCFLNESSFSFLNAGFPNQAYVKEGGMEGLFEEGVRCYRQHMHQPGLAGPSMA